MARRSHAFRPSSFVLRRWPPPSLLLALVVGLLGAPGIAHSEEDPKAIDAQVDHPRLGHDGRTRTLGGALQQRDQLSTVAARWHVQAWVTVTETGPLEVQAQLDIVTLGQPVDRRPRFTGDQLC